MTPDHLKAITQKVFIDYPSENFENFRVLSSYRTASHDSMVAVYFLTRYRLLFIDKQETTIKIMNSGTDSVNDYEFALYAQGIARLIGATILPMEEADEQIEELEEHLQVLCKEAKCTLTLFYTYFMLEDIDKNMTTYSRDIHGLTKALVDLQEMLEDL